MRPGNGHGRAPKSLSPAEIPRHHGSHTGLLRPAGPPAAPAARIDAIVVPTSRPASCLRQAIRLARGLDSLVVALCSRSASADEAVAVGADLDARVIAIDVGGLERRLPLFDTSRLLTQPRFQQFRRTSDLSAKRNLGLLLARVASWQRVLFLDDDIAGVQPAELRSAAGLLPRFRVVGLKNGGFPDNSVVCHAYRRVGGEQASFIGGGAMLVAPDTFDSYFPNIYSEDWFFLFDAVAAGSVTVGGEMIHKAFDPYADPDRARSEEFGDLVAEGLFGLLDDGDELERADREYWRGCLHSRRALIEEVLSRLRHDSEGSQARHIIASLEAARSVSSFITPTLCVDYVRAWHGDRLRWREFLSAVEPGQELEKALADLGLAGRCVSTLAASSG